MVVHGTQESRLDIQRRQQFTEIPPSSSYCSICNSTVVKYLTDNLAQCGICFHQWRWVSPMTIEVSVQKLQSERSRRLSPSPPLPAPDDNYHGANENVQDTDMAEFDKRIFDWMENVTTNQPHQRKSQDNGDAAEQDEALRTKKLLADATITTTLDPPMDSESATLLNLPTKNLHNDTIIASNLDLPTETAPFASRNKYVAVATTTVDRTTKDVLNDATKSTTMNEAMENSSTTFILPPKKIRDDPISSTNLDEKLENSPKALNLPKKKLRKENTLAPILGTSPKISATPLALPRRKQRRKVTTVVSTLPTEKLPMESAPKESTTSSDPTTNSSPSPGSPTPLTTKGNLFIPKRRQKQTAPTTATVEHRYTNSDLHLHYHHNHLPHEPQDITASPSIKSVYPKFSYSTLAESINRRLYSSFVSTSSSSHTDNRDANTTYADQVNNWLHENPVPSSSAKSPWTSSAYPSQQQQANLPQPSLGNNGRELQYSHYVKATTSRTSAAEMPPFASYPSQHASNQRP